MNDEAIFITNYDPSLFQDWYSMTTLLYPNSDRHELREDLEKIEQNPFYRTFLAKSGDQVIGFITLSIRTDYVEGARTSPVGYMEAIYVKSDYRSTGVARLLFEQGEAWLKAQECTEIGSDTWHNNKAAQDFHLKLGFKKEDVLVHYIKKLE